MCPSTPNRRSFLITVAAVLGAAWTAAAAFLVARFVGTPLRQPPRKAATPVGRLNSFGPDFQPVRLRIPIEDGWYTRQVRHVVYVRRDDDGHPFVLSGKCTHLSCHVRWHGDKNEFICPCHEARFAADGAVLGGPPPAPLQRMPAEVRDGEVVIRIDA